MATIGGSAAVESLIETALRDQDQDGTIRWHAITLLHARGDLQTFLAARRLCAGETVSERMLGVDILGRLGFVERSLPVLRFLAASEDDCMVLYSVLIAFGHLRDRRALPSVIALGEHPDRRVRYGAAYALPNIMGSPPDPMGLAALRRLIRDPDDDVADWACLGLALSTGREVEDVRRQVLDP
ncbi:HEAT repeat domain-containing protein [Streptosporangium sp. NBC_01756]|uniref:HEAT repeat domain-containing protein n=1 Tax=Streptosporangium sp. NBC_01756 TaxID=2975950 RepID=UPI002DDB4BBD|nr:HEAT repeat domain-containing protein [Streptosporangium sp. NBC_01756]WSC82961.1 HEAT repeat domain-containing protein [Streptosporangium sp. NBC_01756]